ncbi:synaptotagmin-1 [Cucumis sativus]|nr:synaptotagmin-1 [Cucumis sativus]
MAIGTLEVKLANAKGLRGADFLGRIDPYVLIQYKGQEHKSSVAKNEGGSPVWNEKFTFRAEYPGSGDNFKIILRIMDHDTFSADDFIGQASIYVKDLLALGVENGVSELWPQKYRVVGDDLNYNGEIQVGVTFTQKVTEYDGEELGGWKQKTLCHSPLFIPSTSQQSQNTAMAIGTLEVKLVNAKGLGGTDFLGGIDPYVLIQYKGQEHKSGVARNEGGSPVWNEKFTFRAEYPGSGDDFKIILKILDHDTFSADDFIGQTSIYVKDLLALGAENGMSELRPQKYSVVGDNLNYTGEILVGLTFTRKETEYDREEVGGWKQSEY